MNPSEGGIIKYFPLISQNHFSSSSSAIDQVKKGNVWAAVIIPGNFSADIVQRVELLKQGEPIPEEIINGSTVEIYEDVTSEYMFDDLY